MRRPACRHQAPAGDAFHRDEGAPQGGRQHRAGARWALRLLLELRHRRPISAALLGARAAAAAETSPSRRQRRGRGQALLGPRRHRAQPAITSCSPTPSDDKGSELYTVRIRDLRDRQRPGRRDPRHARRPRLGATTAARFSTCELDEQPPPAAVYRHVVGTPVTEDVLVYEEKDTGFFVGIRLDAVAASSS